MIKFMISLVLLFFVLFLIATLPVSGQAARFPISVTTPTTISDAGGIGNPGEGWKGSCKGNLILSESIYGFEVWTTCKDLNHPKGGWERGCYGNVVVYAIPGVRNILCIEWGIP